MRSLYVMSKPLTRGPRLIGVLYEDNGNYQFKYKLGGIFPEFFLQLKEFPDPVKIYDGNEVTSFIRKIIPKKDDTYIKGLLESAGLNEYDEWELLKVFGQRNPHQDAYLFEELPEGAVIYERMDDVVS